MASGKAKELKEELLKMSDESFEPLTLEELGNGQSFITLPMPGDNCGHGGLREKHHLFVKVSANKIYNKSTGKTTSLPDSTLIIRIEIKN